MAVTGHVTMVRERLDGPDVGTAQGKGIRIPAPLNSSTHVPIHGCTGMGSVELRAELRRWRVEGPVCPHCMVLTAKRV